MAVLKFDGYRVDSMSYSRNSKFSDFENKRKVTYHPEFEAHTIIHEDTDKAELTLNFKVPDDFPFLVEVTITGSFSYVKVEDKTGGGLKNFVQVNGSAILFPYIRAIVSQLTGMANEYTPLLLPTINIGAILAKHSRNESK